jgi:hypothetical protein
MNESINLHKLAEGAVQKQGSNCRRISCAKGKM